MDTREAGSWSVIGKTWRAILVVDVVESVRLMQHDEAGVIDRWLRFVDEVQSEVLPSLGGKIVKSLGDGLLLEFESVPSAAAAALDIQRRITACNRDRIDQEAIQLRVGAHACEVIVNAEDIFGTGVNLTARLAGLASPGQIVVSEDFCRGMVVPVDGELDDLGDCYLKHVDVPVHAYALSRSGARAQDVSLHDDARKDWSAQGQAGPPTLGILPFCASLFADEGDAVGILISDCLTKRLSASNAVRVISSLSSHGLSGRSLGVSQLGKLLGADYLVSGRFSGSQDRILVHLELTECATERAVWVDRAVTSVQALLEIDDDFSAQVGQLVLHAVNESELGRVMTMPLPTLHGFALEHAAMQLMHRSGATEFHRARDILDHLIDRYPRMPSPQAWLANWYVLRVTKGLTPVSQELESRAIDHARRALDNDPGCALALAARGFVQCHVQKDLDGARASLEHAVRLNPSESLAWLFLSVVHGFEGHGDAAWASARQALALAPLDPQRHYFESLAASAALCARQYTDAIALARSSLRINRSHPPTLRALAIAEMESGLADQAKRTAAELMRYCPDFNTRKYVSEGPRGAEDTRRRYALALEQSGVPAK